MAKTIWNVDPVHSEVTFKVRHMMITNVGGTFDRFTAVMLSSKPDFSDAEISFEAEIDSVNTRNEQRDAHLKSDDFFNAAAYPKLTFKATSFKKTGDSRYEMSGPMTIRNTTRTVVFHVEHTGIVLDSWGQTKVGFEITGTVNRMEFGLLWNAPTEDGGIALSEEVKIFVNIQLVKQV
ncbi:MAG: hypothetical protein RL213_1258, partial [Bacteroidota bacterium]|jgi:polyisoprenoid-binding protein YceI